MTFDIDFINEAEPTVTYDEDAQSQFEQAYAVGADAEDIGGLVVYTVDSRVVAVYDYENFVGWQV
jgi:hypothetical protein